ncbi:hypothetical protein WA026_023829 [Henosepilachna vigintioctopunctata]|uniref:Large ribosomal subunit protein mL40 n=1 Tax=Henosepilachna vigintioctopunctata TaxID=420089 RepID=A0AAW1VHE0_9CUCU
MLTCWKVISNMKGSAGVSNFALNYFTKRNIFLGRVDNIQRSQVLWAEPMKKKKRIDPAVVKAREERRKKKLEKQIRRLERNAQQLKPIDECEIPLNITDERDIRKRENVPLPENVLENRAVLQKMWSIYKQDHHLKDIKMLDRIMFSQQKALDQLRLESEEFYQEAIQTDFHLIPFSSQGPVQTPAIDNYEPPDGDYLDISKKWE